VRIWVSDGDRRLDERSGYGQVSAAVSRGLIELGHEVRFQEFADMDVVLYICPPGKIKFGRRVRSAAITMHELDHLPPDKRHWPAVLNRLDLVITPTNWNREVWERAGVTTPIEVVPLGVDTELFYPATGLRCTFLCVHENLGGSTSRENWSQTLRVYLETFTREDDVRLVIKTWKWKPEEFQLAHEALLDELGVPASNAAAVEVLDGALSTDQMRELYQGAWLLIKNANREGWSIPCTEVIACGTPVAASAIEPLLSHLPEDTRWFQPGDSKELQRLLREEHARFVSRLRLARRHDASVTTKLVELALRELTLTVPASGA
jgi:glycosyltransferase involved in cell wall biosynthesis